MQNSYNHQQEQIVRTTIYCPQQKALVPILNFYPKKGQQSQQVGQSRPTSYYPQQGQQGQQSHQFTAKEKSIHLIKKKVDYIMSTNNNIETLKSIFVKVFNNLITKVAEKIVEKAVLAKFMECIVSYSLHELFTDKSTKFYQFIEENMSVNKLGLKACNEEDGYNLFTWAVWYKIKTKIELENPITRNELDVIKTVNLLMKLKVSPFKITKEKTETIFDTINVCVAEGKYSEKIADQLYSIILESEYDDDVLWKCVKQSIPYLKGDQNPKFDKFHKTFILWCLTKTSNEYLRKNILTECFKNDIEQVALASTIDRTTGNIEFFLNYNKLLELGSTSENIDNGFKKYFSKYQPCFEDLRKYISTFYQKMFFEIVPKLSEIDISSGYNSGTTDVSIVSIKNFETIGAFLSDITQQTKVDTDKFNLVNPKIKAGFGIKCIKSSKTLPQWKWNIKKSLIIEELISIYDEITKDGKTNPLSCFIENSFKIEGIPGCIHKQPQKKSIVVEETKNIDEEIKEYIVSKFCSIKINTNSIKEFISKQTKEYQENFSRILQNEEFIEEIIDCAESVENTKNALKHFGIEIE
jgi:hypothetical protein